VIAWIFFSVTTLTFEIIDLGLDLEEAATLLDEDIHYLLFLDLFNYKLDSESWKSITKIALIITQLQYYIVFIACQTLLVTSAFSIMITLSVLERKLQRCSVNQVRKEEKIHAGREVTCNLNFSLGD